MKVERLNVMAYAVAVAMSLGLNPEEIRASGFPLVITTTGTNYHLATATTPASRLAWLTGSRLDAITNLVELESLPLVQHSYTMNFSGAAAFYRAVLMDTNTLTTPLAVGAGFAVAITTNGIMQSWGDNSMGQFGTGSTPSPIYASAGCWYTTIGYANNSQGPLPQSTKTTWSGVAAGDDFTLAVRSDGTLWSWGNNTYGSLGVATNGWSVGWSATPQAIGTNALWRSVFACGNSSFAIRRDGTLWGWGNNNASVLGVGTNFSNTNTVWFPNQVGTSSNWLYVACTPRSHAVGIQTDGSLWAWGQTYLPSSVRAGYAATNLDVPTLTSPALVNIPGPWIGATPNLATGGDFIFLRGDGTLWEPTTNTINIYAWSGYFGFWQNQYTNPASSYNILINYGVAPADAYGYVYTNLYLALNPYAGNMNPANYPAFLTAVSDANFLQPDPTRNKYAMLSFRVALSRDGTIWTQGEDATRSANSPKDGSWQRLNADTDWRFVTGTRLGVKAAIKADGSVWIWNEYGQLNLNAPLLAEPVQIPTNTWLTAKVSGTHAVGLDTQSNLWVWGGNTVGQLGVGDYEPRLAPTLLPVNGG